MTVLNKKHGNIPQGAIYIGRGSRWGNPFLINKHGTRDQVCDLYERALRKSIKSGAVTIEDLAKLHGKDLVCYCAPKRCHGNVLEAYAKTAASPPPKKADPMDETSFMPPENSV